MRRLQGLGENMPPIGNYSPIWALIHDMGSQARDAAGRCLRLCLAKRKSKRKMCVNVMDFKSARLSEPECRNWILRVWA